MISAASQAQRRHAAGLAAAFAVAAPMLLAFNLPPSPTFLNQALACGLWGVCIAMLGRNAQALERAALASWPLGVLMLLITLAAAATPWRSHLPGAIALSLAASMASAFLVVCSGAWSASEREPSALLHGFLWGLLGAGVLSTLVSMVQVFSPDYPGNDLIAHSGLPGRGVGNLRQPNHLATLLLWSTIAAIGLFELRRLGRSACLVVCALLVFGIVLSGSRTGALGVLIVAAWGLLDRRMSRDARNLSLATPLGFALAWTGMAAWAHFSGHVFGAEGRISLHSGGDISSSRFAIWSNAWHLISSEPLLGVGVGEFNLAWTLTEFANRPVAFFDHTHNLPLQFAVELGLPMAAVATGLLLMALMLAWRRAVSAHGEQGVAKRAALMLVVMILLHSMLEYPLWYAYFLLPAAFAWGYALAMPNSPDGARQTPLAAGRVPVWSLGVAMTIGAGAAALDYYRIAVIYEPPSEAAPLEDRIALGQRSPLFAHHADYAAATAFGEPKAPLSASQELAFRRAPHHLLDIRLMIAWSQALAAQGKVDKARWLAARIREFRNPGADEFFGPCANPVEAAQAFQCQAPQRSYHWREFVDH